MSYGADIQNGVPIGLPSIVSLGLPPLINPYPALNLDFVNNQTLDPRITFTRASSATYFDQNGVLQTASNDVARFDHDPATLQPLGLLIEEQRTNSIRNNTMQGAVAGTPGTLPTNWSVPTTAGLTTNVIGTGTSNGITYIDLQVTGTTTSTSYILTPEAATQIAALNGQTWTMSAWWSIVSGDLTNVTAAFFDIRELNSGGVQLASGGTSVSLPTSTFTRISATRTITNASTAFVQPRFRFTVTNGAAVDFTLRIGLPQLEQGAFATSVIPTTSASATRNADVASMTGTNFSDWFNAGEGTLYADWQVPNATASCNIFSISDGTTNNRFQHYSESSLILVRTSASGVPANNSVGTSAANTAFRVAFGYGSGTTSASDNGSAITTTTQTLPTTLTALYIGASANGTAGQASTIRKIAYYPARLTDAQLQALTG